MVLTKLREGNPFWAGFSVLLKFAADPVSGKKKDVVAVEGAVN